ncbi:OmpA family protein [Leptolyngbya sp. 15MV]|nr:OmpA family protein [Leptolyngbya sp. 15MV]
MNRQDYDMVITENSELRNRLSEEQRLRTEAETRNASLEQENRDLAARADRTAAAPGAARAQGGATGFEGIEGAGVTRAGGDVVVDVAGDVLFDSGSATLKASARRTLDRVADVIKSRYPNNVIRVEGHTDTDPLRRTRDRWETNERLSGERAYAVERYLVSRGVSGSQIYFAGFGSARPKGTKQASRRVEIIILGPRN